MRRRVRPRMRPRRWIGMSAERSSTSLPPSARLRETPHVNARKVDRDECRKVKHLRRHASDASPRRWIGMSAERSTTSLPPSAHLRAPPRASEHLRALDSDECGDVNHLPTTFRASPRASARLRAPPRISTRWILMSAERSTSALPPSARLRAPPRGSARRRTPPRVYVGWILIGWIF